MRRADPSPVPPAEGTEDELERLRALVRNLPGIVYVEDADPAIDGPGPFLYVSPAVERILGYTVEEWLADPAGWVDRLHPDDVPSMRAAFQAIVPTGAPYSADYRMFAKDGRIVWIHDEAVLLRDAEGAPLYWQGVMSETTERTAELERALTAEREEAAELRAIDELKTTFLQAVSHDLRTPLAAILGLAVTLESQEDLGSDEARDLASRISMNARKLDRIVSDLLDLDRISRGILEPNLRPTDLAELVHRVVTESDLLAEHPTELELDPVNRGRRGEDRAHLREPPLERRAAHAVRVEQLDPGGSRGRRRAPGRRGRRTRRAARAPRGHLPAVRAGRRPARALPGRRHRARGCIPLRRAPRRPRVGRGT
jgi:PAS domain S-box-containing protein